MTSRFNCLKPSKSRIILTATAKDVPTTSSFQNNEKKTLNNEVQRQVIRLLARTSLQISSLVSQSSLLHIKHMQHTLFDLRVYTYRKHTVSNCFTG